MNISMHTNPQRDYPLVAVSTHQLRKLIHDGEPPRLSCWDKFCHFFLNLICCACGGNRRATEEQLREIYRHLHPREERMQSEEAEISEFFTRVETLISLTDELQRRGYHFTVSPHYPDNNMISLYYGEYHVAERTLRDGQLGYLLDHSLILSHEGGPYQLSLPLEGEEERRCRMEDYTLMQKCLEEQKQYGSKLTPEGTSLQHSTGGSFPQLHLCCDRQNCSHVASQAKEHQWDSESGELSLTNQKKILSFFPHYNSCCARQDEPLFLPQSGEPHLADYWQQIKGSVKSYQQYHQRCCQHNCDQVKVIVAHVVAQAGKIGLEEFDQCHQRVRETLHHAEFWHVNQKISPEYGYDVKTALYLMGKYYHLKHQGSSVQATGYYETGTKLFSAGIIGNIQDADLRHCLQHLCLASGGEAKDMGAVGGEAAEDMGAVGGEEVSPAGIPLPIACKDILFTLRSELKDIQAGRYPPNSFPEGFESLLQQAEQLIEQNKGEPSNQEFLHCLDEVYKETKEVLKSYWRGIKRTLARVQVPFSNKAEFDEMVLYVQQLEKAVETWPEGGYKREARQILTNLQGVLMAYTVEEKVA